MGCERYVHTIHELTDGTLGAIRRAELEPHLEDCAECRRLADDLARVRDLAASLDRPQPPDRVWMQIAGRLRQEGRVAAPSVTAVTRRYVPLALAAALLIGVGWSLVALYPRGGSAPAAPGVERAADSNAAAADVVEGVEAEFRLADQHYQNAIAKLEEAAKSDNGAIDPETAAVLRDSVQVMDRAIALSRAALKSQPQNVAARDSLFDALKRKVALLQDTIALMNQMRKGDAAGAAQIVDGVNKS